MKPSIATAMKQAAGLGCAMILASSVLAGPRCERRQPNPNTAAHRGTSTEGAPRDHAGYRYTSIQCPGAAAVFAADTNDRGMVSGEYIDANGTIQTFVWSNGECSIVAFPSADPGTEITLTYALNNNNILFGNWGSFTIQHAGMYNLRTRTFTKLPDIDGKLVNLGFRLNERGIAVGAACDGDINVFYNCTGWRWDGRKYEFFNAPGAGTVGVGTVPNSINEDGVEVGYWDAGRTPETSRSYARDRSGFVELKPFGLPNSVAYDINNSGQILMLAPLDPAGYWAPALLDRGRSIALPLYPDPASIQTLYTGINNRGDLSGFWLDDSYSGHSISFLPTPALVSCTRSRTTTNRRAWFQPINWIWLSPTAKCSSSARHCWIRVTSRFTYLVRRATTI